MNATSEVVQKEFRITQIVWVAIFVALLIYTFIGHFFADRVFVDPETTPVMLINNILIVVGAILLGSTWFIRKRMLFVSGSGQPLGEEAAAVKYRTLTIVVAGICETVGLFGLVLVFLGDSLGSLYFFNSLAVIAMVGHRPRMEELQRLAGD